MKQLEKLLQRAETSTFYKWLLNVILRRAIPFNNNHRFKIISINKSKIEIEIPFRKSNLNHIKGLHACGLAAVSEYATGMLLMYNLNATDYRLILQSLHIDFLFQGKSNGYAVFSVEREWIEQYIVEPLKSMDSVQISCEAKIFDSNKKQLTTCTTIWQIKKWDKVKTKV